MKKITSLSFAVLLLGTSVGYATDFTREEQAVYDNRVAGQKISPDDSNAIIQEIIAARASARKEASFKKRTAAADEGAAPSKMPPPAAAATRSAGPPVEVPDTIPSAIAMGPMQLGPTSLKMLGKSQLGEAYKAMLAQEIYDSTITDKDEFLRRATELKSLQDKREAFASDKAATMAHLKVEPVTTQNDDGEDVPDLTAKSTAVMTEHYADPTLGKSLLEKRAKPRSRALGGDVALIDSVSRAIAGFDPETLKDLPLVDQIAAVTAVRDRLEAVHKRVSAPVRGVNKPLVNALVAFTTEEGARLSGILLELEQEREKVGAMETLKSKDFRFIAKFHAIILGMRTRLVGIKDYITMEVTLGGEEAPDFEDQGVKKALLTEANPASSGYADYVKNQRAAIAKLKAEKLALVKAEEGVAVPAAAFDGARVLAAAAPKK